MIEVIHRYAKQPFRYGTSDCCQFVGDCLQAVHGINPALDFIYSDEMSMRRQVAKHGSMDALLTATLGEPGTTPHEYDVALVEDQQVVGIVYKGRIVVRTETDVNDLPLYRSTRFWTCRKP